MIVAELRGRLLSHFYNLRYSNGGIVPVTEEILSGGEPISREVIAGVCRELADVGLIEWTSYLQGHVIGSARIRGPGVDAVERGSTASLEIRLPDKGVPITTAAIKEPGRINLAEGLKLLEEHLPAEEAKARLRQAFVQKAFPQAPWFAFEYEQADIDWDTGSVKIPRRREPFSPTFSRADFNAYFFEDDDKNSEHGARTGYAAGSFVSPNALHGVGSKFPVADTPLPPNPDPDVDAVSLEPAAIEAASQTVFGEGRLQGGMAAGGTLSGVSARGQAGEFGREAGTLSGVAAEAKAGDLSSPPDIEAIIPPQVSGGSHFKLDESGRIDLVPDPPANADERQRELYDELRHKAHELSGLGHNQLADLSTAIDRFSEALPDNIEAVSITRLWSRGNSLRRRLDAHDLAVGSAEPSDPARLTPSVAEQLRDLVETFNVFILGEPNALDLERVRLGPQGRDALRAIVNVAEPIARAVQASIGVATPAAAQALSEQIDAARDALSVTGVNSDQAAELGAKTSSNFVAALLRVATWIRKEAAFAARESRAGIYRWSGPAWIASGQLPATVTFIVDRATELKAFVEAAFHNPALRHVIDAIVQAASF